MINLLIFKLKELLIIRHPKKAKRFIRSTAEQILLAAKNENILTNEYVNKIYDIRQVINDVTFDVYRFIDLTNDLLNIVSRLRIEVFPASVQNTIVSSVEERNNIVKAHLSTIRRAFTILFTLKEYYLMPVETLCSATIKVFHS